MSVDFIRVYVITHISSNTFKISKNISDVIVQNILVTSTFFFHLVPKMAAPKNGMKKRLLFTLLHSLSHYGPIPLERLKIGESCSPNNKCEKSSKQALRCCLSKPYRAIWFWSNNEDAKCANFE